MSAGGPRSGKKIGPSQRDLAWRIRRHKALQRLIGRFSTRNPETLSQADIADLDRARAECEALGVTLDSGDITVIPHAYVADVVGRAVEQLGGMAHFDGLRPGERHRLVSVWLRERGLPVPSISATSKFFRKIR